MSFKWLLSLLFICTWMASSTNTTTNSPTNTTTSIAPTVSPSAAPTDAPSDSPTDIPTPAPTNASTTSTTTPPSVAPTVPPTTSPSDAPTNAPTAVPSIEPTTEIPTLVPSVIPPFTTSIGPEISVSFQLLVNFSLNFTSNDVPTESMDTSLKRAYSAVGIPSNYIHSTVKQLHGVNPYLYDIFSRVDAANHDQAANYEKQINHDPDSTSQSKFAADLKSILNADKFDMSIPYFDIDPVASDGGSSDNDTTQIIIWFLGVSAVCAIGALLLIICWRKFSGKEENENDNAINLEFLLDPNANDANMFASPMHINEDHSLLPQDLENDEDLKPIKKKKKVQQQYFSRLGDETHDVDQEVQVEEEDDDEEQEEEEHGRQVQVLADEEQDDIAPEQPDANYEPPNFSRI